MSGQIRQVDESSARVAVKGRRIPENMIHGEVASMGRRIIGQNGGDSRSAHELHHCLYGYGREERSWTAFDDTFANRSIPVVVWKLIVQYIDRNSLNPNRWRFRPDA
jgi:hypothetical protein